ncbi:MAG: F0F1 ATP synthase subunit A [Planctomycetes bacterium]|jgi:F-type H+-transporting ATPase subunit a|nr:F0F1 ATP synthase subunit A [Planctomycetota bacterium]
MGMFGMLLSGFNPLEEVATKTLFVLRFGSVEVPFTNHMLIVSLTSLLMMILIPLAIRRNARVPRGFHNVIEAICVFLREDVARPFLKEDTDRYIGVIWSLFFFILCLNLMGLVPLDRFVWLITRIENNHIGGAPTSNIWVTGALATFAFLLFHLAGIRKKGFAHYLATLSPKVPWPLMPFMFVMELLSSFVRLFSLAIRLFANILAGHILLGVLLGFIVIFKTFMVAGASIIATTLLSLLEIFVAFLQAYIFTFLTTIFIGFAIGDEEH